MVLEAERQAKVALDKMEIYAVLATIDKQELTFPLLNIKTLVQEAMNTVNKEFAIPIPALIGQKAWREERTTNINDAIKAFVTSFRSLITCRATQIHTSHSVAPMVVLTNSLIGTEHRSWGYEHHQKRSHKVYPENDNLRRFVALITTNRLKLQKCDARSKYFQLFILSSE